MGRPQSLRLPPFRQPPFSCRQTRPTCINKRTNGLVDYSDRVFVLVIITMDQMLPEPAELGTLIVVVMKAKNLHNKRALSKQNPFCSVRIAKSAHKTKTIDRGGQSPVWDHEVRFKIYEGADYDNLKLSVFDQSRSSADIIGDAVVPLSPAFEARVKDGYDAWHPIYFNKRYVGEVYLEMTYYSKTRRRSRSRRSSVSSSSSLPASSSPNSSFSSAKRMLPQIPQGKMASSISANVSNVSLAYSRSSSSTRSADRSASPSRHTPRPLPQVPVDGSQQSLYKQSFHSVPNLHQFAAADTSVESLGFRSWGEPAPPMPASTSFHQDLYSFTSQSQDSCATFSRGREALSPIDQDDISRQINDGFGDSMFERMRP